jgi:hypothetical protein
MKAVLAVFALQQGDLEALAECAFRALVRLVDLVIVSNSLDCDVMFDRPQVQWDPIHQAIAAKRTVSVQPQSATAAPRVSLTSVNVRQRERESLRCVVQKRRTHLGKVPRHERSAKRASSGQGSGCVRAQLRLRASRQASSN